MHSYPRPAPATIPARPAPPRPNGTRPSPWRIPILLWLVGSVTILTASFRIALIISGLGMETLPDDYEGAHYLDHLAITAAHIIPGIVFLALGPLQFSAVLRRRWTRWHRLSGRVFVLSGLSLGMSGVWMNQNFPPIGGVAKYVSAHLFGVAMLAAIGIATAAIMRGNVARHRVWMIRAFAIGLAPATQRILLIPVFVALGEATDTLIDVGMTVGWLLNVGVAEWILWRSRRS